MIVYHFINAEHGLDDLSKKRLKIATLKELNDPFELFGVNLSDEILRQAFLRMKEKYSRDRGILCFSKNWENPVLWSHYAEKHRGLCFCFNVPDRCLTEVYYSRDRLVARVEDFTNPSELDNDVARKFLFTKYEHWMYEEEVRSFVTLKDKDPISGLYFVQFSSQLELKQVIIGAESETSIEQIYTALGTLAHNVDVFKAKLAFNAFRVIR